MNILITYDVDTTSKAGARRLRKVAKACKDYGQRVQNSVFECQLTEAQLAILKNLISDIIDKDLDSIRIYDLNRRNDKTIVIGKETSYRINEAIII